GLSAQLIAMPEKPTIEHSYSTGASPQELVTKLRQIPMLAGAEIKVVEGKVSVRGRQEDQDAVSELLAGRAARRTTVTNDQHVYSLRIEMPVGKLLEALQKQMDLNFQIDKSAIELAGLSLDKPVKLDVKEVSEDELLRSVLEPAGLTFRRLGN